MNLGKAIKEMRRDSDAAVANLKEIDSIEKAKFRNQELKAYLHNAMDELLAEIEEWARVSL